MREENKTFTFSYSLPLEISYNTRKKEKQQMTYCMWWEAGKKKDVSSLLRQVQKPESEREEK